MTLLGLCVLATLMVLAAIIAYAAGYAEGSHNATYPEPKYADPGEIVMHSAARAYNRAHPEPTLRLDVCGYEYATVAPREPFICGGCNKNGIAVAGHTCKVEVAYNDESAPLGRRQDRLGYACGEQCAEKMFDVWLFARMG